jgi:unsaturated chondroitin disaccharide hydrolase
LYINDPNGNLDLGLGGSHSTCTNIAVLEIQKWYHVVLTWDRGTYFVYVNGNAKASGPYTGLNSFATFADIGNDGSTIYRNESFDGVIDEVRLYRRALGASEVQDLYLWGLDTLVSEAIDFAESQLASTASTIGVNQYPFYTVSYSSWYTTGAHVWTSGFYPSSLWLAYEHNNDPCYLSWATSWTEGLEEQATAFPTQDLGFIIFNNFGKGFQLTGNAHYKDVVMQAATTVAGLYNPTVGMISANWGPWDYPVNIDSMMAVELLFWASKNGGQPSWYDIAVDHSNKVAQYFVRPDGSSLNFANFNSATGEFIEYVLVQAYSLDSTWSRGQAWGIYGFTVAYRETSDPNFLLVAEKMADYYVSHLPFDSVPYWDFNASDVSNYDRDTSAASIAAAGLLELSSLALNPNDRAKYYQAAREILISLCSRFPAGGYLAQDDIGNPLSKGLLLEGCYHHPLSQGGNVYNESLVWGDYYFIQSLLRYLAIMPP